MCVALNLYVYYTTVTRDSNTSKGRADDIDEPKTCNDYSTEHSVRKGRKCKSPVKPETLELTLRKFNVVAVAQDTPLPHPEPQTRHPKGQPILPPRRYRKDEDFTSQLDDRTMQKPGTDSQVRFEVHGNVILTHRVPSRTVNENAIYHPLLPYRKVTNESSESNVYQSLTIRDTTSKKEEEDQAGQTATGNENSAYQPLIFKSATENRAQNQERGKLVATSEMSHYQPLVFPKERKKPSATHVMMIF